MANYAHPSRFKSLPDARNVNIMLDLETACSGKRTRSPAIIEIAAVHFDLHSGEIYNEFQENVNLKSCTDLGLVADKDPQLMTESERRPPLENNTILWLQKNIPETYLKSLSLDTSSPLPDVLGRFSSWVNLLGNGIRYPHVVLWGKPAVYDNIWISNAYAACKLEEPWGQWANMCCMSVINLCYWKTGILFSDTGAGNEKFLGDKHHALDDCKHQVRMVVKAANCQKAVPATENSALNTRKAPSHVRVGKEQTQLSPTATTVLNSLISLFYNSTEFATRELRGSPTMKEIECRMHAIRKVMEHQHSLEKMPAKEPLPDTQSSGKKRAAEPNFELQQPRYKGPNSESTALDDEGLTKISTGGDVGNSSDYGEDSDLDDVFHSFSA